MKVDDALETLTRFFNDLIGTVIPGAVLVFGLAVMHLGPEKILELLKTLESGVAATLALAVIFAAGHALLALYFVVIESLLDLLNVTKPFESNGAMLRQSYIIFQKMLLLNGKVKDALGDAVSAATWSYNDLRSVALSISSEASSLGRRFMFIALLCNGVGTSILLMLVDYLGCVIFAPKALFAYPYVWPILIQSLLMLLVAGVLFKQGRVFHFRAMTTPFSVAVAELAFKSGTYEP